ncbi:hypothetical protein LCGC14_3063100, partial [marine sediment metagenome]
VLEFTGVDPTNPLGMGGSNNGTTVFPGLAVIRVVQGSLVVGMYGIFGSLISGTPVANNTERVDHEATNRNLNITTRPQPLEGGTVTVATELYVARNWVSIGWELLETGTPTVTGEAILTGVGDLSPTGQVLEGGNPTVTLTGVGDLSPTGTAGQMNGTATFTGIGDLSPTARTDDVYRDESQAGSGGTASVDQAPTGP